MRLKDVTLFPVRYGIWSRLLTAFGMTAAITVMAAVTALLVFNRSNAILGVFTEVHLPEVVQVAELEETGGEIIAMAPLLLSAPDETTRNAIQSDLDNLVVEVAHHIDALGLTSDLTRKEIEGVLSRLKANLADLQTAVTGRLEEEARLIRQTERLRWLYADLLGELDPLNQDLAYNLDSEIERMIGASLRKGPRFSALRLRENRKTKDTVEKIGSNGILLVSLMLQASTVQGDTQIDNLAALSADAMDFLRINLVQLPGDSSFLTLRQVFDEIFTLADGPQALFSIKKKIHQKKVDGQQILSDNRTLVLTLRRLIDTIVADTQQEAIHAAAGIRHTMRRAQWLLLVMVLFSLVTTGAVLWFYVRGSIVKRLDALARSMRAIAQGDLDYAVPKAGEDEIGQMAEALRVFKDTAEARRKAQSELVQAGKLAALGQLTAGISHELTQPLSAIRYYLHNARLLLERGRVDTHTENLTRIGDLVERMAKMITHLKTFARWPSEALVPVTVAPVIDHALSLFAGKIKGGGIQVVYEDKMPTVRVCAEEIRLEQVLINLIGNAVDAVMEMPPSDRRLSLEILDQSHSVEICVTDSGPGIPPESIESIFDPFYTTKEVGKGLGLGLSISYNIVKDFKGTLTAHTPAEGGTRFTLTLPNTDREPQQKRPS
ncbi:ATP-binding protein [Desulfoluna sp.]|uniref:ATP-binding protein n=1 Tax=Desulfoluna sp. TaxID=2045199 RepID=UPI002612A2CF|nr:ATP-binding protein [Desulfoluna sp.]